MDESLSRLIPTNRIGNDGFNWWVGQIEGTASGEENNKGGYRYKVRIVGDHPESKEILGTKDLPWANVMMPVNVPFMPGNKGGAHPQLEIGCWVVGFYLDNDGQKPLIMGSIGQTPGATTVVKNRRPGSSTSYDTALPSDTYTPTDGTPPGENPSGGSTGETNKITGALADGSKTKDGKPKVPVPNRDILGMKDEKWCQSVAEKCDEPDMKEQMTIIMGEFLAEIQNNNGNIGSYLVSQATGKINSAVGVARKKVSKAMRVIREFIARVKGFVIEKLTAGVKDLIKALLYPNPTGNVLTPVTEWFNKQLKDLGCKMEDLGDRLAKWLTNVLMSYVTQAYKAAACLLDTLVNGILSKINSLIEEILGSVLGPLQDILGVIAAPLNILGGAINFALKLLGISCSGPQTDCAKYKIICNTGEKKQPKNEKDFLDDLLEGIDNLFPVTGADYTQYTCDEAYKGNTLVVTTIGFTGGIPKPGSEIPPSSTGGSPTTKKPKLVYDIQDITVEEGDTAVFTVTRTGYIESASSVSYKTLKNKGTASIGSDYLSVDGILGFAVGETEKTISVKTLYDTESEGNEDFYLKLSKNSPGDGSGIKSNFVKNIAKCTITEIDQKQPSNPWKDQPIDPITGIEDKFPPEDGDGDDVVEDVTDTSPSYAVVADKTVVYEGDFVVYTITTKNVENGTILYYTLTGNNITSDDIIGGSITGSFVINNDSGKVTVGLEDDGVVEDEETLTFTVNGTGASVDVLVTTKDDDGKDDLEDFDEGEGETPENAYEEFSPPTVDPTKIITDPNGGIIEIPIDNPGDPWAEPPYVFVGGEGIGAIATPLLDENGYITEIRVKSPGYGYKLNLASTVGVRCVVDTFTIISPGQGYTSAPDVYVNGELGIAEAIINDDGFVIGARTLNRELTFEELPKIEVIGGGGYGATMIPSLVCLDTDGLSRLGSTKIGTGRYVDCP